jgi:hypothetical protein
MKNYKNELYFLNIRKASLQGKKPTESQGISAQGPRSRRNKAVLSIYFERGRQPLFVADSPWGFPLSLCGF